MFQIFQEMFRMLQRGEGASRGITQEMGKVWFFLSGRPQMISSQTSICIWRPQKNQTLGLVFE
jgi:hypothetical protein